MQEQKAILLGEPTGGGGNVVKVQRGRQVGGSRTPQMLPDGS